ncbi:MAG: hypothetical protein ACI39F_00995 [Acutalibacteraceae bacterium]
MAKGIIDEIKTVEKQAAEIVSDAENKAAQIIDDAKSQAQSQAAAILNQAENKSNSVTATADNNAFIFKNKEFQKNDEAADKVKADAEKNLNLAVDLIINEVIPKD